MFQYHQVTWFPGQSFQTITNLKIIFQYIIKENLQIDEPILFKPVVFKGQL